MINRTVCILTSGKGTRLDNYSKDKNKSLLSINKKSILTKIIENFPKKTKFIISTGHFGNQVRDFIKIHHPDIKVKFVKIKNYSGIGSGPGTSLYKCKKYLQTPFFFVSCDTLWSKKIYNNNKSNWMGCFLPKTLNTKSYCNLVTKNNYIKKIIDKKKVEKNNNNFVFVGLAHVKDYKIFWEGFKKNKKVNKERQVSIGFQNLLQEKKISKVEVDWEDTGTKQNYEKMIIKYEKFNFNKDKQQIYISNNKVTKFFNEKKIISQLFNKAQSIKRIFPGSIKKKNNFISYKYEKGFTFYNFYKKEKFNYLLSYLEKNFWLKKVVNKKNFVKECKRFYYSKTQDRIKLIFKKYKYLENKNYKLNGKKLLKINTLLKYINWKNLYDGIPSIIHGDLQFDNIILYKKKITLIDWRPNFGKNTIIGDLNYDFAKLLGGLEINYDLIKKNKFNFNIINNNIKIKIPQRKETKLMKKTLIKFLEQRKYNVEKIKILTGLIFLNMSPLHQEPFDKLLFYYGKYIIQKNLYFNNEPNKQ